MIRYIDTHIHLDQLQEPQAMLREAEDIGISAWVVPGVSPDFWPKLIETTAFHPQVYIAPGVHPQSASMFRKKHLEELRLMLAHDKAVAIGEVGLDSDADSSWQEQEEVFTKMVHLALEMEKPLLIHSRKKTERILEILKREGANKVGGIFHAFSGSLESARKIIDMGFVLGIGGVVTFQTARRLPKVVQGVPAEALVLETDAPDMTPEPYRGQLNRPTYLEQVARQVAILRGWSLEETALRTTANAHRVLGLPNTDDFNSKTRE